MRILLVEDDFDFAEEILTVLREKGYAVDRAADAASALQRVSTHRYAAVLLDLGLPDGDGETLLARWRDEGMDMPVLIMTARGSWTNKVAGFEAGADDYLVKPFMPQELVLRLRSQIRRSTVNGRSRTCCGPLGYDPIHGEFDIDGNYLDLTSLEWRVLTALMLERDKVVARDDLLSQIYENGADPASNSLEVIIGRLRRKIGTDLIRTVRGRGYSLTAKAAVT